MDRNDQRCWSGSQFKHEIGKDKLRKLLLNGLRREIKDNDFYTYHINEYRNILTKGAHHVLMHIWENKIRYDLLQDVNINCYGLSSLDEEKDDLNTNRWLNDMLKQHYDCYFVNIDSFDVDPINDEILADLDGQINVRN